MKATLHITNIRRRRRRNKPPTCPVARPSMGESGSMRHRIRTVHHINGRLRLQVPAARANPAVLEEIRKSIAGLPGVTGVHANSRTGSVLVQYSPKAKTDFQAVLADHGERTGGFLLDPPEVSEVA